MPSPTVKSRVSGPSFRVGIPSVSHNAGYLLTGIFGCKGWWVVYTALEQERNLRGFMLRLEIVSYGAFVGRAGMTLTGLLQHIEKIHGPCHLGTKADHFSRHGVR